MKQKLLIPSILISVLSISIVIAASFVVVPTSLKFTQPNNELTFTLTTQSSTLSSYEIKFPAITMDDGIILSFTAEGENINFTGGRYLIEGVDSQETVTIIPLNLDYNEISIGKSYSGNIVIENLASPSSDKFTLPISFSTSFCKDGEKGTDLEITDVKIDNADGDDEEWSPLDEITVQVEVSNNGDVKIKDVIVEIGLFNPNGKNIIKNMDELDKREINLGSIQDSKEDVAEFKFKIPSDFEAESYKLVIKTYSDDIGENELCIAHSSDLDNNFYQSIDGIREEDEEKQIIFNNIKVVPSPAQCGERVQITGELSNIGDTDYEDQVKVTLFNQELGLNLERVIRQNFDQGDTELVDFEFDVPTQAAEKLYVLEFKTHYEYDTRDDSYDIVSDEKFTETLRIEGGCEAEKVKSVRITAELDSETPEALAGEQVAINVNLRNTGDIETTYSLSVVGNSEWSSLNSIDPSVFTIRPGESKEAVILLKINDDAEGDNEFTIRSTFDGQSSEQKVVLTINTQSAQQTDLGPIVEHLRNNWFIYLIILVNIILIIAIILVIRSMVAPSPVARA